jgi:hypothetical protein
MADVDTFFQTDIFGHREMVYAKVNGNAWVRALGVLPKFLLNRVYMTM